MFQISKKLVVFLQFILIYFILNCKCKTLSKTNENITLHQNAIELAQTNWINQDPSNLLSCIINILNRYFVDNKSVTYVDMEFEEETILKSINFENILSIVNRIPNVKVKFPNQRYLLTANNMKTFIGSFPYLTKEARWNPTARFLIVFRFLDENEIKDVLDMLLKYHVIDVLIVNGTLNPVLYTYNPFENYACGKYYTRIINFGKCPNTANDLYPKKLVTGLRNCVFNISASHWPPFSIDPSKMEKGMISQGTEQYVMETIAKIEHFKINFTYNFDAEKFSVVSSDMIVSGPMEMLQNNKTDIMLGGLLLYRARATVFSYLYGHLDHTDDIKIIVKKAPLLATWKLFYMEFEYVVWLCLFITFVVFSMLMIVLLQAQDKSEVILKLLDSLLLHGYRIRSRYVVKCIFVFWLWFTFLINCFYQSNLMSLSTTSTPVWQISEFNDLIRYNIKPCVSPVMYQFTNAYRNKTSNIYARGDPACDKLLQSLKTVSNSQYLYAVTVNSVYMYNKNMFYNKWGQPLLYSFRKPISNVVYAIYLYKGFPMYHRIHSLTLMLKEYGLIQKHLEEQYFLRNLQYRYQYQHKKFEVRFVTPWYIYGFGCFISIVALVIESSSKNKTKPQNN